jgi:hypothetical protein
MELNITTPALLFPAISLLLLAYTNRFLHLASVIRKLHSDYVEKHDPILLPQIYNLRFRVTLIKHMQTCGVASIFGCVLCMLVLFSGYELIGRIVFGLSLTLMLCSLGLSIWEIRLSAVALNLHLRDLEEIERRTLDANRS